jgi:hypothetical protein
MESAESDPGERSQRVEERLREPQLTMAWWGEFFGEVAQEMQEEWSDLQSIMASSMHCRIAKVGG